MISLKGTIVIFYSFSSNVELYMFILLVIKIILTFLRKRSEKRDWKESVLYWRKKNISTSTRRGGRERRILILVNMILSNCVSLLIAEDIKFRTFSEQNYLVDDVTLFAVYHRSFVHYLPQRGLIPKVYNARGRDSNSQNIFDNSRIIRGWEWL